ncbi:putative bifunctional diguanylate cyclase/phosphodiesterase [Thiomicrorhabdus cannonii]|uniref:putative bifunctional diguanylate cyclase/phosphodiesterase n=1 Tax=Thiomicrorhabdus cannonii TaxID=2748011 RepID=UPI0015BF76A7|nr:EAL domain-containing protein [Thiomicrorhabdus cannonii]
MFGIQHFLLSIILIIVTVFYSVFFYYFLEDQQRKTDLILENIRHDLSESAYVISTETHNLESIKGFTSFLNRKVANNPLIDSMAVAYGNQILVTTDPHILAPPPRQLTVSRFDKISAAQLIQQQIFEAPIRFYIQDEPHELSLFIYPDQDYLINYFSQHQIDFIVLFGLIPLVLFALFWLALRQFLTNPLEKLRQYAYYQSEIPSQCKIRELEYVRASMVQTFDRLEQERDELYRLARTDELSGLANRNQLNERLSWLIAEAARNNSEFALLFMDLDDFKKVNDSLGHEIGDKLLQSVAGLIQDVLRKYDIIARVGGDEFVIVLSHYKNNLELTHIIERVLARIKEVHLVDIHPVKVAASIGVAFYPKDGNNIVNLLKNADIAMYEAKNSGKNQFKFFTEELHRQVLAEIELEHDIREALDHEQFELYYQPKISIHDFKVIGAEALIRWNHPTKGFIPPDQFIPAAERNGMIVELGWWILRQAIWQQMQWKQQGIIDIPVSVNLSAVQFLDNHFDENFKDLIHTPGFEASKLDVEITESVFIERSHNNLNSLFRISKLGATISLDDFGTGYSSLAYLKSFPLNTLKIDKSFMDDYASETGAAFIETIVKIAQTLKLHVVAEGVETHEQLEYLKRIGCDSYQGYYCSAPLPVGRFENFIREHIAAKFCD